MPTPIIDSKAIVAELDRLRAEFAEVGNDPELARAYGERLSRLGAEITAACERAFLNLTETPAA